MAVTSILVVTPYHTPQTIEREERLETPYMYIGGCSSWSRDSINVCKSHNIAIPPKAAFIALEMVYI